MAERCKEIGAFDCPHHMKLFPFALCPFPKACQCQVFHTQRMVRRTSSVEKP